MAWDYRVDPLPPNVSTDRPGFAPMAGVTTPDEVIYTEGFNGRTTDDGFITILVLSTIAVGVGLFVLGMPYLGAGLLAGASSGIGVWCVETFGRRAK